MRVLGSLVAVTLWGCGSGSSPAVVDRVTVPPAPSASVSAPVADAPREPTLAWQFEVAGATSARHVAVSAEGVVALAVQFESSASFAGRSFTARGELDAGVLLLSDAGEARAFVQLGGAAEDVIEDLAATPSGFVVAVRSDAAFTEAGVAATAGPGFEGAALLVHFDAAGTLTRAERVPSGARELRLASHPGGDVFLGWSARSDAALFGSAHVTRRGIDGVARWHQTFPDAALHALVAGPDRVVASLRATGRLEAVSLEDRGGGRGRSLLVEKLPSSGDLGTIRAFVHRGALAAYGETGGPVRVDGVVHERPSYAVQPFFGSGAGPAFVDVIDATALVVGAGTHGDHPAALLHVLHPSTRTHTPHRGTYLAIASEPPRLLPLHQVAYPDDDWEHGERQDLMGLPLSPRHGLLAGGAAYLVGTLGEGHGTPTLVRYDLPR